MKIQINDHRKIFALQDEFTKLFPSLKIEFYDKPNKVGSPHSKKICNSSKRLGDCRIKHLEGELTITPSMTAADLKQILDDKYGLSIIILRLLDKEWIESTHNSILSLHEQNEASLL